MSPGPDLENYVTVNTRIAVFHREHEKGAIRSRKVFDDGKTVHFEACAHRDGFSCELDDRGHCLSATGTGTAEEVRGEGFINKTSAVENCETSAIGRALAAAGIEVSKAVASREEVEQALARRQRQEEGGGTNGAAGELGGTDSQQPAQPIGEGHAHALVDRAMTVVDLDRLRLAATHIAGQDVGKCETEDEAVAALEGFSPEQAKRLAEWIAKKTNEKAAA